MYLGTIMRNQNLMPTLSDDEILIGLEISCIEDDLIVTL